MQLFAIFGLGVPELIILALCGLFMVAVPIVVLVVVLMLSRRHKGDEKRRDETADRDWE
jgi:hypothetical protein